MKVPEAAVAGRMKNSGENSVDLGFPADYTVRLSFQRSHGDHFSICRTVHHSAESFIAACRLFYRETISCCHHSRNIVKISYISQL